MVRDGNDANAVAYRPPQLEPRFGGVFLCPVVFMVCSCPTLGRLGTRYAAPSPLRYYPSAFGLGAA